MEVIRAKRQGRRFLDQAIVERSAALHLGKAVTVARDRQVLVLQEVAQAAIGAVDLLQRCAVFFGQPRLVRFGNIFRHFRDRRPEGRFLDLDRQLRVELFDHVGNRHLRFEHAAIHAFAETPDRAVDDPRIIGVATDSVLVILDGLEGCQALPAFDGRVIGMEAEEVVHRTHLADGEDVGRKALQRFSLRELENVIGQPVGLAQRRAVDLAQRREVLLGKRLRRRSQFVGIVIADPVRLAEIAARHRTERAERELCLVCAFEHCEQGIVLRRRTLGRSLFGRTGNRRIRHRSGGTGGERERTRCKNRGAENFHEHIPVDRHTD